MAINKRSKQVSYKMEMFTNETLYGYVSL